jgi:hypothetical protein
MMETFLEILKAAGAIVGGFALLATMTKNPTDDTVASWLLKLINFLGANFGRAQNEE